MNTGTIKSFLGELTFRSNNGTIVLKGEKLKFEGQSYRLVARLANNGSIWSCKIITLAPQSPDKFKLQTCKELLEDKLPEIWQGYLRLHKSMVFLSDKQAAEAKRKEQIKELQQAIERIEVLVAYVKPILNSLLA